MKSLKIKIKKREFKYSIPESINELNRDQFLVLVEFFLTESKEMIGDNYVRKILNIPLTVWKYLNKAERFILKNEIDHLVEQINEINRQLVDYIEIDRVKYIGYNGTFDNTTWNELIHVEQFFLAQMYQEAAAVLYRPEAENYDGESDPRKPFNIYGLNKRVKIFKNMDNVQLFAFIFNYKSLHKFYFEDKYPFIWQKQYASEETEKEKETGSFSWLNLHRSILGDNFFDEDKFLNSNAHTVLNRINLAIKDNLKNKK
jgi:hypothetical protein